jgi:hypothetical protein
VQLYDPTSGAPGGIIASTGEFPTGGGGTWSTSITVPPNATGGQLQVLASCLYVTAGASVDYFDYAPNIFNNNGSASSAPGNATTSNGLPAGNGRFTLSPAAGPAGTVISVQSYDPCVPFSGAVNPQAIVSFVGPSGATTSTVAPVSPGGQWGPAPLTVPPGTLSGPATVTAVCTDQSGLYNNYAYNPYGYPYNNTYPGYTGNPNCFVNGQYTGAPGCPVPGPTAPPTNCYFNGQYYTGPGCPAGFNGSGAPYTCTQQYPNSCGGYFTYAPILFTVTGGSVVIPPGAPGGVAGTPGGFNTSSAGSVTPSSAVRGQQVTISGGGFAPNTTGTVVFNSAPVTLGTIQTDNAGNYSATINVPQSADPGTHTITVTGAGPQAGETHTTSATLTVIAQGRLSFTGASVRKWVILATALVLAGLLLLSGREVLSRQRAS